MGRRVAVAGSGSGARALAKRLFAGSNRNNGVWVVLGLAVVVVVFAGAVDASAALALQSPVTSAPWHSDVGSGTSHGSGKPVRVLAPSGRAEAAAVLGRAAPSSDTHSKAGPAPLVSDPQGDQLAIGQLAIGPLSGGYVWCFGSDWAPISDGSNIDVCITIDLADSISGNFAPATNFMTIEWYDGCGNSIRTTNFSNSGTAGYPGQLESGTLFTDVAFAVPSSGVCYGQWKVLVSFTETFTDGQQLTDTETHQFYVSGAGAAAVSGRLRCRWRGCHGARSVALR
jgi:hypothetical protein